MKEIQIKKVIYSIDEHTYDIIDPKIYENNYISHGFKITRKNY